MEEETSQWRREGQVGDNQARSKEQGWGCSQAEGTACAKMQRPEELSAGALSLDRCEEEGVCPPRGTENLAPYKCRD